MCDIWREIRVKKPLKGNNFIANKYRQKKQQKKTHRVSNKTIQFKHFLFNFSLLRQTNEHVAEYRWTVINVSFFSGASALDVAMNNYYFCEYFTLSYEFQMFEMSKLQIPKLNRLVSCYSTTKRRERERQRKKRKFTKHFRLNRFVSISTVMIFVDQTKEYRSNT